MLPEGTSRLEFAHSPAAKGGMDGMDRIFAKKLVLSNTMSHYVTRCNAKEGMLRVTTAKNFVCLDQAFLTSTHLHMKNHDTKNTIALHLLLIHLFCKPWDTGIYTLCIQQYVL